VRVEGQKVVLMTRAGEQEISAAWLAWFCGQNPSGRGRSSSLRAGHASHVAIGRTFREARKRGRGRGACRKRWQCSSGVPSVEIADARLYPLRRGCEREKYLVEFPTRRGTLTRFPNIHTST
jgi:hypothetical protein